MVAFAIDVGLEVLTIYLWIDVNFFNQQQPLLPHFFQASLVPGRSPITGHNLVEFGCKGRPAMGKRK